MNTQSTSNLLGSALFSDSESFMTDLSEQDESIISGGRDRTNSRTGVRRRRRRRKGGVKRRPNRNRSRT